MAERGGSIFTVKLFAVTAVPRRYLMSSPRFDIGEMRFENIAKEQCCRIGLVRQPRKGRCKEGFGEDRPGPQFLVDQHDRKCDFGWHETSYTGNRIGG